MGFLTSFLRWGSSIQTITEGCFSGAFSCEIIISRSCFIELLRRKPNGKMFSLTSINLGSRVLEISTFSMKKKESDYIFLLDSIGRVSIIFLENSEKFSILAYKNLKKFSSRNKFEGLFCSLNQKSLVCMVGGIENLKYGLIIKKNEGNPSFFEKIIEIKHNSTICFHITSLECYDKNIFACIETSYDKPYDKYLVFYDLNLPKNSIKRTVFTKINSSSYLLIPVPHKLSSNGGVFIISRGLLSLVEYGNKKMETKTIPWQKNDFHKKCPLISCFDYYRGASKILLLLVTEEGCLLKVLFRFAKKKFRESWKKTEIKYLCSLPGPVKSLKIISSGFLFANMEQGNHLHFYFLNLGSKKTKKFYFKPELRTKSLKLIDEFRSLFPILAIEKKGLFKKKEKQVIILCGSKSRSSLRVLQKSSGLDLIRKKILKKSPVGLSIIKNKKVFINVIISFKKTTSFFICNRNIEETNNNGLIANAPTLSVQFLASRKGIFQSTSKKIRFIKNGSLKRKIIEWKPKEKVSIINSISIEMREILILLILSDSKIVIIKLEKNYYFLEISRMVTRLPFIKFIFGINIKKETKIQSLNFFILLNKKERTMRSFSIKKDFSLKLSNVQLLPWCPESAKLLVVEKKINILISLNNGILIQIIIDSKNFQVQSSKKFFICSSPLFISDGNFNSQNLIFGPKIWKIHLISEKILTKECLLSEFSEITEPFGKFVIVIRRKKIEFLLGKKFRSKFDFSLKINLEFTPIGIGGFTKASKPKITFVAHSDNYVSFPNHQMNFLDEYPSKKKTTILSKKPEGNWVSGITLFSFQRKKINKPVKRKALDSFIISGATTDRSIDSVFQFESPIKSFGFLLICFQNFGKITNKKKSLVLIEESSNFSISLGIFQIKNQTNFISGLGGRKKDRVIMRFAFEHPFPFFNGGYPKKIISKTQFGKRNSICQNGFIRFFEIQKEGFNIVSELHCPSLSPCKISAFGNRIFLLDPTEGGSIFTFFVESKSFKSIGEIFPLKFGNYCKFIGPFSIIVTDQFGVVFFLHIEKKRKILNLTISFTLELKDPVQGVLYFPKYQYSKNTTIIFISLNGLISEIKPILKGKKIFNFYFSGFSGKKKPDLTQALLHQSFRLHSEKSPGFIYKNTLINFYHLKW